MAEKSNQTVVIMQPTYMPWLGYFDLIRQADYFVFYDDVQFVKQSWQSRNKINSPQGELFLSVPVQKTKHHNELMIKDVLIDNKQPWRKKHLKSIQQNYQKAAFYSEYVDEIKAIYDQPVQKLADFNIALIKRIADLLEISTEFIRSSTLDFEKGPKEEGIIAICNHLHANHYLSPAGAMEYLDNDQAKKVFSENNIEVEFQQFDPQVYAQKQGGFTSHLGIFDALLNIGPKGALQNILDSSRSSI